MIKYKIDILQALKKAGYNQTVLQRSGVFGSADLQKMRRGVAPGIIVLNRLCCLLNKQPGAILEYIPDPDPGAIPEPPPGL